MNHETVEALIPAYALGATELDETALVEAHLQQCARCRARLADYRLLSDDLLYAIPLAAAPPHLTDDLRRRVTPPPVHRRPRGRFALPRLPAFAAVAATVTLLLLSNLYWMTRTDRLERRFSVQSTAIAILAEAPTLTLHGDAPAPDAHGVLYFRPGSTVAILHVYGLPSLPQDKTYQVWLIRDSQRESAGFLQVNEEGEAVLLMTAPRPMEEYDGLGVTVEPAGGSPGPTSPRVIGGTF